MLSAAANSPVYTGEHGVAVCGYVAQVYRGNGIAESGAHNLLFQFH